jgi:metallo-beta-lactamase family protein
VDAIGYDVEFSPAPGVRCNFRDAGHILGSAIVEAWVGEEGSSRKLVFSGDLGQPGRPLLNDPTSIALADVVVVESTYGNRLHKTLAATYEELSALLRETLPGGNVVIPAFAVGRTQEVLHVLTDLVRQNRAPDLTIFVDSPLATRATEITLKYAAGLDAEGQAVLRWQQANRGRVRVRFTETPDESKALNSIRAGAVIIAASGMCDAGRIKHHLQHNLGRSECAVVFTGFQAAGTLGRQIVDGAREVRLFREDVQVRARIATIGGLSAHADQAALLGWVRSFERAPARAFVVHGEHETALAFADRIRSEARWPSVEVPLHGAHYRIV